MAGLDENLNVWERTKQLVREAAAGDSHPFAVPALCSSSPDGHPRPRKVVLRAADEAVTTLRCYTDRRSVKARHLAAGSEFSYLFWDDESRIQFACGGPSRWADEAEADRVFNDLPRHGRKAYATRHAPGTPLPGPESDLPAGWDDFSPEQTDYARKHFGILITELRWGDLLQLHRDGNLRQRGSRAGRDWTWEWVTP